MAQPCLEQPQRDCRVLDRPNGHRSYDRVLLYHDIKKNDREKHECILTKPPFEPSSDHSLCGSGRVASPSTEKGTIMFITAPTTGEFITELDELLAQLAVETPFTDPSTDPVDIGEIANWPAHVMPGEPVIVAEIIDDDPAESVDEILEELVAELVEVRWDPNLREHVEVYEVPEAA